MKINNKINTLKGTREIEKEFIEEMRIKWDVNALSPMNVIKDTLKFKNKQFQKEIKELCEDVENLQKDYANLDICDKEDVINLIKKRFGEIK